MSTSIYLAVALVFLWVLPTGTQHAHPEQTSGCSGAGLCCPRRDLRCVSQGWRTDGSLGSCFCDAACYRVGDCCADYENTCPTSLCKVSQWSYWSGCALPCSPSYRERVRSVLQHPHGSAPECPALRQRAVCMTDRSHSGLPCSFSLLPAAVTSAEFMRGDISKPYEVRPKWQEYCVEFEVLSVSAVCGWAIAAKQHTRWVLYLRPGVHVCVRCEPSARRGQDEGQCHGCRCGGMHLEQQAAKDYGDDPPSPIDATVPHNIHCSLYELARSKPFSKGQLCDLIQSFSASIKQNLMLPKLLQKKGNRSIKKYLCLPLRGKVFFPFIVILLLFFNILGIIFTKIHIRVKLKCSSTGDKCVV